MRNYTTLGAGKNTKVLAVSDGYPARVVTSTTAEAAAAIAAALGRTDRTLLAALHPLARALDGTPVQARRRLLGIYDTAAAATPGAPAALGDLGAPTAADGTSLWQTAAERVARLGDAVAGTGPAVTAAIRDELAGHLAGLDGVLVPAWIVGYDGKYGGCPVVLNPVLGTHPDLPWADPTEYDEILPDDDLFPLGGPRLVLDDTLAHDLADQEAASGYGYESFDVEELLSYGRSGGYTEVYVRLDHAAAWAADRAASTD